MPPLIESETRRKRISTTVKITRRLYRHFRSNLSREIRQSNVLPKDIQQRLLKELDRRLDLDVDELLGSPKLKVKLSPAELDRRLLDFYNNLYQSPGSDVLRVIGGGSNVGRQNYYLKQQALKRRQDAIRKRRDAVRAGGDQHPLGTRVPQFLEDVGTGEEQIATRWIKRTLQRNLSYQQDDESFTTANSGSTSKTSHKNSASTTEKGGPYMSLRAKTRISINRRDEMSDPQKLLASRSLLVGSKCSKFSPQLSFSLPSLLI